MRLKDKKIIVTAAAQGIGRATAMMFAKEGATVIATDINEEKLNELNKENNLIKTQKLDATNKKAVENFVPVLVRLMFFFMQWVLFIMESYWNVMMKNFIDQ